jgi:2-oxoglutarate ferredoxin oxidoreductase subunit beta
MFDDPKLAGHLPRPFGVFYESDRACYEDVMEMQLQEAISKNGKGDLDKLLKGRETWTIS